MDYNDGPEAHTSPCLMSCLQTFGNVIFPGDRDVDQVCKMVLAQFTDTIFVSLYCCDINCGMKFESGAGHDFNVNQVITKCRSFGISNISDPGPPPVSECSSMSASASAPTILNSPLTTNTISQAVMTTPLPKPFLAPLYLTASSHSTTLDTSTTNMPTTILTIPSQTTSPSIIVSAPLTSKSHTFWQKLSTNARIGCILGLILLILLLLISILFIVRHRRNKRSLTSRSLSSTPELPMQSPPPSPSLVSSQISTSRRDSTERSRVGRGGGAGCRSPHIVVFQTEGKNSVDSEGIRWPDEVVLTGEAKEMREWSLGYGLGKTRRAKGEETTKDGEKRLEYERGLEKI